MADGYSLRDVERLLGLSRSIVSGMIDAGFVAPTRGRRREYRFSFQDLVVLRAAQALSVASIPRTRILRSLRRLRAQLPREAPLAGLRIEAVGDAVVVSEGDVRWRTDNGQYLLQFDVAAAGGRIRFIDAPPRRAPPREQWFERAVRLEADDPGAACDAYRRAIAGDAQHRDAYVNLGRLLHERGLLEDAMAVYREGLSQCASDATLHFNLGVLLEDAKQPREAAASYRAALASAPDLADAHHNLARLCAGQGLQQEALRHWSAYRKLTHRR